MGAPREVWDGEGVEVEGWCATAGGGAALSRACLGAGVAHLMSASFSTVARTLTPRSPFLPPHPEKKHVAGGMLSPSAVKPAPVVGGAREEVGEAEGEGGGGGRGECEGEGEGCGEGRARL